MKKADKILVALSGDYVEALGEKHNVSDESVTKVTAEYHFVKNLLHESGQVTDKLILCWMGDKYPKYSSSLFGERYCYKLPSRKGDFENNNPIINVLFGSLSK